MVARPRLVDPAIDTADLSEPEPSGPWAAHEQAEHCLVVLQRFEAAMPKAPSPTPSDVRDLIALMRLD